MWDGVENETLRYDYKFIDWIWIFLILKQGWKWNKIKRFNKIGWNVEENETTLSFFKKEKKYLMFVGYFRTNLKLKQWVEL